MGKLGGEEGIGRGGGHIGGEREKDRERILKLKDLWMLRSFPIRALALLTSLPSLYIFLTTLSFPLPSLPQAPLPSALFLSYPHPSLSAPSPPPLPSPTCLPSLSPPSQSSSSSSSSSASYTSLLHLEFDFLTRKIIKSPQNL